MSALYLRLIVLAVTVAFWACSAPCEPAVVSANTTVAEQACTEASEIEPSVEAEELAVEIPPEDVAVDASDPLLWLGLTKGTKKLYAFRAHVEHNAGKGRGKVWEHACTYEETVIDVLAKGTLSVVEIDRALISSSGELPRPADDVLPQFGRFHFVISDDDELLYEGRRGDDFTTSTIHRGTGVIVQHGEFDAQELDDAAIQYVLPLHPGTAWHADIEERRQKGATSVTGRNCFDEADLIHGPAGTFTDCYAVSLPSSTANEEEWVCEEVGLVRRWVVDAVGSLQYHAETTLIRFEPALEAPSVR